MDALREAAATGVWADLDEASAADFYSILTDERTRAVKLRGAQVSGELDLEAAVMRCPLVFENCTFSEDIRLDEATAPVIRLVDCTLPSLSATQLETRGDLNLTGTTVNGDLNLAGAHIGGVLSLHDATINGTEGLAIYAESLQVDQTWDAHGMQATGRVHIVGMRVGGEVDLRGARIENESGQALTAHRLHVANSMFCNPHDGQRFVAKGGIGMIGAHIGSQLNFDGALLQGNGGKALDADSLEVGQYMFCRATDEHRFWAIGTVDLLGARIGSQILLRGAELNGNGQQALNGYTLQVGTSLFCDPSEDEHFSAVGEIDLIDAQIGGVFSLVGASLSNESGAALRADGLRARNVFCWSVPKHRFTAVGEIIFTGAHVENEMAVLDATLSGGPTALNLYRAELGSLDLRLEPDLEGVVDLRKARIGSLKDTPQPTPPRWPQVQLDGCTYSSLEASPAVDVATRIEWLRGDPDGYLPQPYEQLAATYRREGNEEAARRVGISKQQDRRSTLGLRGRLWNLFLGATVAHGYRPSQALVWLLCLLGVGSYLFNGEFRDDLIPAKADPAPYQPVIYTLDLLVPVISLGQRLSWNPEGTAQWVALALTVSGWLLTAALLGGIAARRQ